MKSKRSLEGYLLIENRHGPVLTEEQIFRDTGRRGVVGAGVRGTFEAPTLTCSHCNTQIVVNPGRTRDREYCRKCDHYVCDECSLQLKLSGECRPLRPMMDEARTKERRLILP